MISFSGLSAGALFQNIHLSLKPHELTCLTGPNGSGKSTLIGLIQENATERRIASALLQQTGALSTGRSAGQHRFDSLAAVFRRYADLALLDEPTIHLDRTGFDALIRQCRIYSGPLLIVTHDRRLLKLADRILHLEAGRLEDYGGGWQLYQRQREREQEARQRESDRLLRKAEQAECRLKMSVERQEGRRNQAEAWNLTQKNPKSLVNMQRNRADRTRARLETHHRRLLHDAEEKAILAADGKLSDGRGFDLRPARHRHSGRPRITVQQIQLRRGTLFTAPVSFTVSGASRIAVTGPNGSGKSTLIEALLYKRHIASGEIIGNIDRTFLLDQGLTMLSPREWTVAHFFAERYEGPGTEPRTVLAASGFPGGIQQQALSTLSGGERMRLALALAFANGCELLILDEPTNDLDRRACEELEAALRLYNGALIVISHDETFLESVGIAERIEMG